ncbi:MAG TPA: alcohol acetyltransferase, partial [Peptococcaceae bacterium]|nr:alcohol acetyltransferase [Peptococcaceae bacterium]
MNKWTKLDNAAIVFPSLAKAKNSTIYRVSAVLKETVLPVRLQQALDITVKRYPMMTMRIHKGLFWRYMEYDDEPLRVKREDDYPCHPLQDRMTMEALLKVFYYQRRISVEVFHAITDGSGAMEFLKTLVYEYLRLLGKAVEPEDKI